jgi:hypothetical protein
MTMYVFYTIFLYIFSSFILQQNGLNCPSHYVIYCSFPTNSTWFGHGQSGGLEPRIYLIYTPLSCLDMGSYLPFTSRTSYADDRINFQMIVPKPTIVFHALQIFFNFLAMACFASVATFQAHWKVGPCTCFPPPFQLCNAS